ncbi:hypothetical protein ACFLQ0_01820 [Nitrospinota bacterium]
MRNRVAALFFAPIFIFVLLGHAEEVSAAISRRDFRAAVKAMEAIPYNPRPSWTDPTHVTGTSTTTDRNLIVANFHRVEISAPANGRTFAASDPSNAPDITLMGYLATHTSGVGTRPWLILTHGGVGTGSSLTQGNALINMANELYANGHNVLLLDRRDGLLTRCAYEYGTFDPDSTRSQRGKVGAPRTQGCGNLPEQFRTPEHTPNTLPGDYQAVSPGDVLAAAMYLKDVKGARKVGALSGSNGGLNIIRAAWLQDQPGTDFRPFLLNAILAMSPIADHETIQYVMESSRFSCGRVDAAEYYSGVHGTGIRDFSAEPAGALLDFFALVNGVDVIKDVRIPVFILYSLTENDDFATEGLAYKAKTDRMRRGHTMILPVLGHFHQFWMADPYWADKMALTYFKGVLAPRDTRIGDAVSFSSAGPATDNPYLIDLTIKKKDTDKFLIKTSVVPILSGVCY